MGELWLFAGSNGAGKSTFIGGALAVGGPLEGSRLFNPDLLTKALLEEQGYRGFAGVPATAYRACFIQAAEQMERRAREALQARQTVCVETILSTQKYLALVETASSLGLPFNFVYVFV